MPKGFLQFLTTALQIPKVLLDFLRKTSRFPWDSLHFLHKNTYKFLRGSYTSYQNLRIPRGFLHFLPKKNQNF